MIMHHILQLLLLLMTAESVSSFSPRPRQQNGRSTKKFGTHQTRSSLFVALPTNLEYMADERYEEPAYRNVQWIDPSSSEGESTTTASSSDDSEKLVVPIYPIPAVYLPHANHTLINVEARNLKMALDLNQTKNKLFCVTLRAADTGRISKRGTLLKMVDMEPTYRKHGETRLLSRIIVYCEAVGIVDIARIENPASASRLERLKGSSEYLKGQVVLLPEQEDDLESLSSVAIIQQQLAEDLARIKTMYELGIGSHGTISTKALQDLANAIPSTIIPTISDETSSPITTTTTPLLWQVAQLWQSVCDTIRVGRQSILAADRNEFLVEAACRKGGPLKLPVHPEDLEPADRKQLLQWETTAQEDFYNIQLDACLDFLPFLTTQTDMERWSWLATLIARERSRLEEAASNFGSSSATIMEDGISLEDAIMEGLFDDDDNQVTEQTYRKGAWFDDGVW